MAAQANNERITAAATLMNTVREINRYKSKPDKRKKLLQSKLERLSKEKDELFNKHCLYADKASLNLQDKVAG